MCEEQEQSINNNNEIMTGHRKQVQATMACSENKARKKEARITRTVEALARRNITLDFVSRKRMIFESWRVAVKQQKAFLLCVINVLEKSMTMKGYHHIKQAGTDIKTNAKKYRHVKMFILRFLKRNIGDYFNKWKNGALVKVEGRSNEVRRAHEEAKEAFKDQIRRTKEQNGQNVVHYFQKRRMKAIFRGWIKHKNYLKILHAQQRAAADCLPVVFRRRALQKWLRRVDTTRKIRFNFETMERNKSIRLKRLVWNGIRARRSITARLSTGISNLEKLFRDKAYMETFKTVKSYSTSRKLVSANRKSQAKVDIASLLAQIHLRRLRRHFCRYQKIAKDKKHRGHQAKKILLNLCSHNLRWVFEHWRKQNVKVMLVEELNQTGPITEEVFEANRTITNLKAFLQSEHYTDEEIAALCKDVFQRGEDQMKWLILRLKQPKTNRVMQRCFDHWVFWLKVKRAMKYHLRFCSNQVAPVRCDIRWAFDKWRSCDANYAAHLARQDYKRLQV